MDKESIILEILNAYAYIKKSEFYNRTPLVDITNNLLDNFNKGKQQHKIFIKNEVTQQTGSFKVRGLINQVRKLEETAASSVTNDPLKLVTYSAGNYGRSFATVCHKNGLDGYVVMPDFAPMERTQYIQSLGVMAERITNSKIEGRLKQLIEEDNRILMHPFDDWNILYGHASFGIEILEDVQRRIDICVVPCGGGGILAGVALALRFIGQQDSCKIVGVEPESANTMQMSLQNGKPYSLSTASSIASGLSPPSAGHITFQVCHELLSNGNGGIVTVTDNEIMDAMVSLHKMGIAAEPSGSASMAALLSGKIDQYLPSDNNRELNIVVAVTGGNCSSNDLQFVFNQTE